MGAEQDKNGASPHATVSQPSRSGLSDVQLALYAGWTMAVLYGTIPARLTGRPDQLPTSRELDPGPRRNLELARLRHLLTGLLPGFASTRYLDQIPVEEAAADERLRTATLELLNEAILIALTGQPAEIGLAYELGRSLRDTANPPARLLAPVASGPVPAQPNAAGSDPGAEESGSGADPESPKADDSQPDAAAEPETGEPETSELPQQEAAAPAQQASAAEDGPEPGQEPAPLDVVGYQLSHARISKLQEWLAVLADKLPELTAAVVAGSLGKWSDFAAVTLGTSKTTSTRPTGSKLRSGSDRDLVHDRMRSLLLQQGDAWLMLLIGEEATAGLLTPEGYVAAGESALHRSGQIVRRVIRHYWAAFVLIAAALGAVLYLALTFLRGGGEVWTCIGAIVSSVGVSAQTVASRAARLASEAGKPVFQMSEEDAMAWAITTLPEADLTFQGVRKLRRAGVAPTSSLGRV